MELALSLTAKTCILILIGFAAKKAGLIDDVCKEKLSGLLVNLLLPVNILVSSQQAFNMSQLRGVGKVALIAVLYYVISLALGNLLGRCLKYEQRKRAMFMLLISFANTGFLGMPFLEQILGDTGLLYGAIYNCVFDLVYFSYGIFIIGDKESRKTGIKGMLSQPLIWTSVAMIILYVLPWRAPAVVTDALGYLANMMLPVSMLIIGAEVAGIHFKSIVTNKSAYVASLLRMFLIPAATFALMKFIHMEYEVAETAVLLSTMPSASLNVVMSQKYKNNTEFATTVIMQNTILMIATLPVITYACGVWL